jgi:hypothetical protein
MRVERRVVVDTNVLMSAVLSPLSKPFAYLRWVLDNATLIVLRELAEELVRSGRCRGILMASGAPPGEEPNGRSHGRKDRGPGQRR